MTTVVLALLLGLLGLTVVFVASLLILGPLRGPLFATIERGRVRRCIARRRRGDARLAAHDLTGAVREFAAAFCFLVPRADRALVDEISRLHIGLLSRFVSIGDDLPGHRVQLLALAKVERFLEQWTETQRRIARRGHSQGDAVVLQRQRRLTEQAIKELADELLTRRHGPLVH